MILDTDFGENCRHLEEQAVGSVFGVRASLAISKAFFQVLYRFPTAGTGGLDSSNRSLPRDIT